MKNKLLFVIAILVSVSLGQNVKVVDNQNNLRLKYIEAIRLENQNQPDKALENYRELFTAMPEEKLFYSRYFDLLFQLKKLDELSKVLTETIANNPQNDKAKIDLGKLYYIQEDSVHAKNIWKKYLKEANYSKMFSEHLFYTMISLRLRDEAEALLLKSREIYKDELLYCKDLGDYYFTSGNYKKSIIEYLKYLKEDDRNFNYISDVLLQFPKVEKVFKQVDSVFVASINKEDDINVHKLRSDYLFINKAYDKAAVEVMYIEKMTAYAGVNILQFCDDLIKAKEYEIAKKVYTQILNRDEFNEILTDVLLGLAKVEEQMIVKDESNSPLNYFMQGNQFFNSNYVYIDDEKNAHLMRAFAIYDSLSSINKDENISGNAEFNIANLRFFYVRDFDGAISNYELVDKKSKSVRFRHQNFNNKLLAIIAKGNLAGATKSLNNYKKKFYKNFDKDYLVNSILLDFLKMDFDKVIAAKDKVIKDLGFDHPVFNDYFELLNLIESNYTKKSESEQKDFQRFVTAEFLLRQSKLGEAVSIYEFIINNQLNSPIKDEANFRLIQIYMLLGKDELVQQHAESLVKMNSEYGDLTAKMLGEYFLTEGNLEKSKDWFQTILLDYPNSFYIETARSRLREIRGDNL